MSNKLCHCHKKSPAIGGQVTVDAPFELDEQELEYFTPPKAKSPSPPATAENHAPITVPTPPAKSPLCHSDAENLPLACCHQVTSPTFTPMSGCLVEVEETEDEANWVLTDRFCKGTTN